MKITIESITEWGRDEAMIAGDSDHGVTGSGILTQLAVTGRL